MNEIILAVEQIESIPAANVDANFRQGREQVLQHFLRWMDTDSTFHSEVYEENWDEAVDDLIADAQHNFQELREMVEPYELPEDYSFFLEFYGGLSIDAGKTGYRLELFGLGPMVEELYGYVVENNSTPQQVIERSTLLYIGYLRLPLPEQRTRAPHQVGQVDDHLEYHWMQFYLDLSGAFAKDNIVVLERCKSGKHVWKPIASSFTEFLVQIAGTEGGLGYL